MFRVSTRKPVFAPSGGELMTKQSMKNECDINNILSQYKKTGIITHVQAARPTYEDLPDASDFQEAQNLLIEASHAFDALPSKVRDFYQNDPYRFLDAIGDPDQHDKLREFGVLKPLPEGRQPQPPSGGSQEPATPPAAQVAGEPPAKPSNRSERG